MQRRKKQKNELERWAERAAEGIIFRPDQREVERELLAHLEDKAADLARIFPDMEREEAEKRAVEQMGDPKEIGRALARLHRPWLGWLWRLSQIALAWAVLWSLREAVPDLLRGNQYWFQEQVYLSAQDCYLMGEDPYGPEGALTGEVPEAAERELLEVMRVSVQKDSDRVLLEILPDSMEAVADLAAEWVEDADAIRGFLSFCYDAPPETAAALRNPGGFS